MTGWNPEKISTLPPLEHYFILEPTVPYCPIGAVYALPLLLTLWSKYLVGVSRRRPSPEKSRVLLNSVLSVVRETFQVVVVVAPTCSCLASVHFIQSTTFFFFISFGHSFRCSVLTIEHLPTCRLFSTMPYRAELKRPDLKGSFPCSICQKVFCHSSSLSRHRMQAHFKSYTCTTCNNEIPSKYGVETRIMAVTVWVGWKGRERVNQSSRSLTNNRYKSETNLPLLMFSNWCYCQNKPEGKPDKKSLFV